MVKATIALQLELSAGVWTDVVSDVVVAGSPAHFEYGVRSTEPNELVATTGTARFALNNSIRNSGAKLGYYTSGHANVRSGFDEGIQARVKFTYGGTPYYKWVGRISAATPVAGLQRDRQTFVQAVDWMDQAASQKISQLAIQSSKRVDQVLPTIVADMPIAPRATSYATGVETFTRVFDTDSDEKTSPLSLFSKLARNEYGFIYLKGDTTGGETLRFDSRHTRALNQTVLATLNQTMQEFEVQYARSAVKNLIRVKIYPKKIDAAATTVLYTAQQSFSIAPGASVPLVFAYRDPTTGQPISATEVVTPLVAGTDYKFGTTDGAQDLNASLGQASTVGGNSIRLVLTNNSASLGYVGVGLQVRGKGIYAYDPQTFESKAQTSINKRGELALNYELEQHDDAVKGEAFAAYLKNRISLPVKIPTRVRFLANASDALMLAFLQGEPSSRITLVEFMTAINGDYFINGIAFDIEPGGLIWCEWIVVPAESSALFIWNTSRWNINTYWAF